MLRDIRTLFLMSLCNLLPKSLNIVDPPERTTFYSWGVKPKNWAYLKHVPCTNHACNPLGNVKWLHPLLLVMGSRNHWKISLGWRKFQVPRNAHSPHHKTMPWMARHKLDFTCPYKNLNSNQPSLFALARLSKCDAIKMTQYWLMMELSDEPLPSYLRKYFSGFSSYLLNSLTMSGHT